MYPIKQPAWAEGKTVAYFASSGESGKVGIALRIYPPNGEFMEVTEPFTGSDSTEGQLIAVNRILKQAPLEIPIVLVSSGTFVAENCTDRLEKWKLTGWRSTAGKPIKYREQWEDFLFLRMDRDLDFRKSEANSSTYDHKRVVNLARDVREGIPNPFNLEFISRDPSLEVYRHLTLESYGQ
jgi:ribonuclease HI